MSTAVFQIFYSGQSQLDNSEVYFISAPATAAWPTGALGNLTVSGTTILTAGQVYDYNNITINVGGVLKFTGGDGTTPTVLGYTGVFTLSGTIECRQGTTTSGGTFSTTAPDGFTASYTITQSAGADAGFTSFDSFGGLGSAQGGGGGGGTGSNGSASGAGGAGGNGVPSPANGGAGGAVFSGSGSVGAAKVAVASNVEGGSGGGGAKGYHGSCLYIKGGAASSTAGTGTIDVRVSDGGAGGNGGQATNNKATAGPKNAFGGSGGGGGAGGSGGKVIGRYKSSLPGWTYQTTFGAGGAGGTGGLALSIGLTEVGGDGNYGNDGLAGSTDLATF